MIEISLFGALLGTLASALSVVLLIVALTSVTYIAMTVITALRTSPRAPRLAKRVPGRARLTAISTAALGGGVALLGLRVGSAGSGGELIPTLSVSIAFAAALGSIAACVERLYSHGVMALGDAREARARRLSESAKASEKRLAAENRRHLEGDDLAEEVARAEDALGRLRGGLEKLTETERSIEDTLDKGEAALGSDVSTEYRRAQEEVKIKLELGERVLAAAEAATFRLVCNVPLRRLVRRRPKEALLGIERLEGGRINVVPEEVQLDGAVLSLLAFLEEINGARKALDDLPRKRPRGVTPFSEEDPWHLAHQDLDALEDAYEAVRDRIEVIRVRRTAEVSMAEVADAASEVSASAKALSTDAAELSELATEVTRAETAMVMATPIESDPAEITLALARCTEALDRSDGASLDELLKALRSMV